MSKVRLVPSTEVEARLKALRCYWAANMDDGHHIWMTRAGTSFVVPAIGSTFGCWEDDLEEIEGDLRSGKIGP